MLKLKGAKGLLRVGLVLCDLTTTYSANYENYAKNGNSSDLIM